MTKHPMTNGLGFPNFGHWLLGHWVFSRPLPSQSAQTGASGVPKLPKIAASARYIRDERQILSFW
jgi:hypothetical protein